MAKEVATHLTGDDRADVIIGAGAMAEINKGGLSLGEVRLLLDMANTSVISAAQGMAGHPGHPVHELLTRLNQATANFEYGIPLRIVRSERDRGAEACRL